jgi:hypothetical protein
MRRWSVKRIVLSGIAVFAFLVVLLVVALVYQWLTGSPPTAPVSQVDVTGGSYDALTPAQRRLVDDWVARYSTATGASAVPKDVYDSLALSTRTTFNAVTHALSVTALTDRAGRPMDLTALDLIAKVDAVAGSIPGQSGDRQFRMYVQLRPDTQRTLEQSREFIRQVDNTVYHKGYPICFRGSGGTPSIQVSLARDGTHGDIDVDYRSSTFPIMLINGHLTASNSDVRAGDNDERHNAHWSGLLNWWRGFMGLPVAVSLAIAGGGTAPTSEPRLAKGTKPEDAIYDFLHAWLVEQDPGVAVGYVAPRAFACLEVERGAPVDRGVARFQLVKAMQAVNQRIGKASNLADVVRGVSLVGPRGREIAQPHRDAFVMYDVREDLAEAFDCENKLHPEKADAGKAQSTKFGEFIGAVFQLKTRSVSGEAVATLWAKENGAWRLVAYDVEPEFRPGALPSAPAPLAEAPEPATPTIDGDPAMRRAARDFLQAWYVRKDSAAAFRYLSPKSFACYNVYRPENTPPAGSPEEAGRLIQERMKLVADWAGTGSRLGDILIAVEPHHPNLKLVKHDEAGAYSIVAVPDSMGNAVDCAQLKPGEKPRFDGEGPRTYGRFYAVSLRFKRAGAEAAVLWTVWARQGQEWKVVSYLVITP